MQWIYFESHINYWAIFIGQKGVFPTLYVFKFFEQDTFETMLMGWDSLIYYVFKLFFKLY